MPEIILQSVLSGALELSLLLRWLRREPLEDPPEDCVLFRCNRIEFAAYFVSFLRTQIDSVLQCNSNLPATPHTPPVPAAWSDRLHHRSTSDPTASTSPSASASTGAGAGAGGARHRSHGESPPRERRRPGRRVKTKLFNDDRSKESVSMSSDESRLSVTPISPTTPLSRSHSRSETPRRSSRHSHSRGDKSCLGDYIVSARDKEKEKEKKKRKSKASEDSESRELDLSNSDVFPAIGEHKSSQKPRRIKPTSMTPTSAPTSAPGWGAPGGGTVQSPAWGLPTTAECPPQATLCVERNMLKLERKRLQDKFNPVTSTPIAKPIDNNIEYIAADPNKVTCKDKLDSIVTIYDLILDNNLAFNVTAELYRLIYVLVSKQSVCSSDTEDQEDIYTLVRSIHNCTYVGVKCVWNNRQYVQLLLDDGALKQLGESKSVRTYSPELAKFLLNEYGLRSERRAAGEGEGECEGVVEGEGGPVCFNMETDNVDNFPSVLSFQNFKKQRDMYYEIYRWWCGAYTSGGSRASLRARVKALLAAGAAAPGAAPGAAAAAGAGAGGGTLPHLAALLVGHLLAECTADHESRLSKLQRRLAGEEPERTSSWKELFYREAVLSVDSASLRAHVCDALTAALLQHSRRCSPSAGVGVGAPAQVTSRRELRAALRRAAPPARLLAALLAAPYSAAAPRHLMHADHTQPCIDLVGVVERALRSSRLVTTLPWVTQLLAGLDHSSLRTAYYTGLITTLVGIYRGRLSRPAAGAAAAAAAVDRDTRVLLTSALGRLFSQPHFPHHLLYEHTHAHAHACTDTTPRLLPLLAHTADGVEPVDGVGEVEVEGEPLDGLPLVEGRLLAELCGVKRHLRACTGGAVSGAGAGRHVTPVCVGGGAAQGRGRGQGQALQARLGAALAGSVPGAWRRAAEHVAERVAAAAARDLPALLPAARQAARRALAAELPTRCKPDTPLTAVVVLVSGAYRAQLAALHGAALQAAAPTVLRRCRLALAALLPAAPPALAALTARRATERLRRWLLDYWPTTAVLCKDIEAEARELLAQAAGGGLAGGPGGPTSGPALGPAEDANATQEAQRPCLGAAEAIILMKEQVCAVLAGGGAALVVGVPARRVTPPACARALNHLAVDLALAVAAKRPWDMTASFLQQLDALWSACGARAEGEGEEGQAERERERVPGEGEEGRRFGEELRAATPPPSDDDDATPIRLAPTPVSPLAPVSPLSPLAPAAVHGDRESEDVFSRLLCPRNVALLETGDDDGRACPWAAWGLVVGHVLGGGGGGGAGALDAQCVGVYRRAWGRRELRGLARTARAAARVAAPPRAGLLAFLADYCADMHLHEHDAAAC